MGLLSYFKRQPEAPAEPAAPPVEAEVVAAARAGARRRLLGATLLLGLGVIGFPLLFETQPRPIPVNIPIEIPRKDGSPALAAPEAAPPLSRASAAVVEETVPMPASPAAAQSEIVERAVDAGQSMAAPPKGLSPPPPRPASVAAKPAAPVPMVAQAQPADDAARARAVLEGQTPPASAPGARVVVQVGAFSDADKLAEARQRVEKLGLKTYTQAVVTDEGKRTRVRVGPFATRAEAEQAAARLKAAGLQARLLTL